MIKSGSAQFWKNYLELAFFLTLISFQRIANAQEEKAPDVLNSLFQMPGIANTNLQDGLLVVGARTPDRFDMVAGSPFLVIESARSGDQWNVRGHHAIGSFALISEAFLYASSFLGSHAKTIFLNYTGEPFNWAGIEYQLNSDDFVIYRPGSPFGIINPKSKDFFRAFSIASGVLSIVGDEMKRDKSDLYKNLPLAIQSDTVGLHPFLMLRQKYLVFQAIQGLLHLRLFLNDEKSREIFQNVKNPISSVNELLTLLHRSRKAFDTSFRDDVKLGDLRSIQVATQLKEILDTADYTFIHILKQYNLTYDNPEVGHLLRVSRSPGLFQRYRILLTKKIEATSPETDSGKHEMLALAIVLWTAIELLRPAVLESYVFATLEQGSAVEPHVRFLLEQTNPHQARLLSTMRSGTAMDRAFRERIFQYGDLFLERLVK